MVFPTSDRGRPDSWDPITKKRNLEVRNETKSFRSEKVQLQGEQKT